MVLLLLSFAYLTVIYLYIYSSLFEHFYPAVMPAILRYTLAKAKHRRWPITASDRS